MQGREKYPNSAPTGETSELNRAELIWAQVKSEVTRKDTAFTIKDVQTFVCEALRNVTKKIGGKQYNM